MDHGNFVYASGRPRETSKHLCVSMLLNWRGVLGVLCAASNFHATASQRAETLQTRSFYFSLPIDLCDGCNVLTSTPAVLKRPSELATVTMWPWFISSILGRNALVVWKRKREREGGGGGQRQLFCCCCSSLPKPFDPFFFPPP